MNPDQPQNQNLRPQLDPLQPSSAPTTQPQPQATQPAPAQVSPPSPIQSSPTETTPVTPLPNSAPLKSPGMISRLIGSTAASILGVLFSWILIPVAIVLVLHFFVFQAFHVVGGSMQPTLKETDYLIISKIPSTISKVEQIFGRGAVYMPNRGQIIVFHYPKDPTLIFVKRVVARAGERVVVKDGHVTVYTADHPSGYNPDTAYEPNSTVTLGDIDETVPSGNVFVLGDNRTPDGSFDSRQWGDLPTSDIIGQAIARLLPLTQVRFF